MNGEMNEGREQNLKCKGNSPGRVAGLIGIGVCLAALILLIIAEETGAAAAFDDPIRNAFYALRSEGLTRAVVLITNLSNEYFMIGLCILLLIIPGTRKPFGVPLSAAALVTVGLNMTIKHLTARPRPEVLHLVEETGFSFPSGHASNSMLFYSLAIYLVIVNVKNKTAAMILTIVFALLIILIGPTRVYLGVHFPSDVLAGWAEGLLISLIAMEILEGLRSRGKYGRLPDPESSGSPGPA